MNCKKANEIMSDYLDSPLKAHIRKIAKLHKHLQKCADCREDFIVYDEMMTNLQFIDEPATPPDDIESCIMQQILSVGSATEKTHIISENVIFWLFGVISALTGVCFVLWFNNDNAQALSEQFTGFLSGVTLLLTQYQYIFFLVAIGLVLIQAWFSQSAKARRNDG